MVSSGGHGGPFGQHAAPTQRRSTVTIEQRAQLIVLGNEKGGSGKSTAAMHSDRAAARRLPRGRDRPRCPAGDAVRLPRGARRLRASHGIALPLPRSAAVHRSDARQPRGCRGRRDARDFDAALADCRRLRHRGDRLSRAPTLSSAASATPRRTR